VYGLILLVLYSRGSFSFQQHWLFLPMSEKRKSAPPSTSQVKNRQKASGIIEKLRVIKRREKGERIVDIRHNVRLPHVTVHKIRENADRIKEKTK
jgi:hypothetical protein